MKKPKKKHHESEQEEVVPKKEIVMNIEEDNTIQIEDNDIHNLPKRQMKVEDLSSVKVRKYKYHDKYEKKQSLI